MTVGRTIGTEFLLSLCYVWFPFFALHRWPSPVSEKLLAKSQRNLEMGAPKILIWCERLPALPVEQPKEKDLAVSGL